MKRVIVIGCPGSGKTTFAEKLNKVTGLTPVDSYNKLVSIIFDHK